RVGPLAPKERREGIVTERARLTASDLRVFRTTRGAHLFVVDGSRIYDLAPDVAEAIEEGLDPHRAGDDDLPEWLLTSLGLGPNGAQRIDGTALAPPPVRSISLNVAQACNMSCHYCYADAGRFGGQARMMQPSVAEAAIDRLIAESEAGASLVVGFM